MIIASLRIYANCVEGVGVFFSFAALCALGPLNVILGDDWKTRVEPVTMAICNFLLKVQYVGLRGIYGTTRKILIITFSLVYITWVELYAVKRFKPV